MNLASWWRDAMPSEAAVRAEIWSLGVRHLGFPLQGALAELKSANLAPARATAAGLRPGVEAAMSPRPAPPTGQPAVPAEPVRSYAEQLAALEARRRAADDVLLRKMLHPRDPMNPALGASPPST